jgi:hypothetical protein
MSRSRLSKHTFAGVYRKLDIGGRADLADALQGEESRVVTR